MCGIRRVLELQSERQRRVSRYADELRRQHRDWSRFRIQATAEHMVACDDMGLDWHRIGNDIRRVMGDD